MPRFTHFAPAATVYSLCTSCHGLLTQHQLPRFTHFAPAAIVHLIEIFRQFLLHKSMYNYNKQRFRSENCLLNVLYLHTVLARTNLFICASNDRLYLQKTMSATCTMLQNIVCYAVCKVPTACVGARTVGYSR